MCNIYIPCSIGPSSTVYTNEGIGTFVQDQYVCGIVVPHTGPVCVWYCGAPYRTSMCVVLWCPIQDQYVCGIVVSHTGPVCVWYCGAPYRTSMCVVLWCPIQDQYVFIHDAILEAVTCGDTQIDSGNLRAKLNKMQKKDQSGKTELELQFAVSPLITTTLTLPSYITMYVRSWIR